MTLYIGSNKITPALLNQESSGGIENTATGQGSLTILGIPNENLSSINIGEGSQVIYNPDKEWEGGIAIGYDAIANDYSISIGENAISYDLAVAIGWGASATKTGNIAILGQAKGYQSIAIGENSNIEFDYCIGLGNYAQASNDYEFVVGYDPTTSYLLMDLSTGKIPNDRINGATGSFTSADGKTITVTNGVITSIV